VHDVLEFVPLLASMATLPSAAYAFIGLLSNPLPSPFNRTAAFELGGLNAVLATTVMLRLLLAVTAGVVESAA
jgi:hypothetical protein